MDPHLGRVLVGMGIAAVVLILALLLGWRVHRIGGRYDLLRRGAGVLGTPCEEKHSWIVESPLLACLVVCAALVVLVWLISLLW